MNPPVENVRILMLEDAPSDAELEECELQDAQLAFTLLRVDTREAFVAGLDEFKPDLVLADYKLPAYNGREALEYTRRTHPQIPVIMVTGAIGDEAAIELLKLGARDYVLKDRLARLAPAIQRALSEERGIRNRKIAEGKYHALFVEAMDGIVLADCKTACILECNPEFERQTGRTQDQLKLLKLWQLRLPEEQEDARNDFFEVREAGSRRVMALQRPDGSTVPVDFVFKVIRIQDACFIQGVSRDITERKDSERVIQEEKEFSDTLIQSLPDIFYLLDREGRLLRWNSSFAQLAGLTAAAMSTSNALAFIHDEDKPLILCKIREAFDTGSAKTEARLIFKGRMLRYFLTATRVETRRGVNVMGIGVDITERKQSEEALLRANRALKTLSAANLALVQAASEDALLHAVTHIIVETGGYRLAAVCYAGEGAEKNIRLMAWSGTEENYYWNTPLSLADAALGQMPEACAITDGAISICRDIAGEGAFPPWQDAALARGYVSNIALPLSDGHAPFGALSIYSSEANAFDEDEVRLLEELAGSLAYGILTLRTRTAHEQHAAILRQSLEQSIQLIADTVEARDPYTAGHQRRVADLASAIAREMGLPDEQIKGIHLAATIHDLGKIHIPAEILSKPSRLAEIEFQLIKTHSQAGYDILKDVKFPWPIAEIVLQHHEKLDGSGYPQGLVDAQILPESKIITVADVVEAMSSHRPYRPGLGVEAALDEITRGRGKLYAPQVVDACVALFSQHGYVFRD
ncbi:MAG: PAS domain S-box protein [Gallionella sp.]|nr:PAS domain S-box protein [Gallionella sp.]